MKEKKLSQQSENFRFYKVGFSFRLIWRRAHMNEEYITLLRTGSFHFALTMFSEDT